MNKLAGAVLVLAFLLVAAAAAAAAQRWESVRQGERTLIGRDGNGASLRMLVYCEAGAVTAIGFVRSATRLNASGEVAGFGPIDWFAVETVGVSLWTHPGSRGHFVDSADYTAHFSPEILWIDVATFDAGIGVEGLPAGEHVWIVGTRAWTAPLERMHVIVDHFPTDGLLEQLARAECVW